MTNQERKKYYNTLSDELSMIPLITQCSPPALSTRAILSQRGYDAIYAVLDQVEAKYEFDLQKIIPLNQAMFSFWQQLCCCESIEGELAAVQFVLFCCLADKFLDSGRFTSQHKELICEKLRNEYFFSDTPFFSQAFPELDFLLNQVRQYLISQNLSVREADELSLHMQRAFDSEIFMYHNALHDPDMVPEAHISLLTDKSVEFELTAFLIASAPVCTPQMLESATYIGRLLWIIDDLWDLPEDVDSHRRNSLLFLNMPYLPVSLQDRFLHLQDLIPLYRDMLASDLQSLKETVNPQLFHCVQWQISRWSRYIYDV